MALLINEKPLERKHDDHPPKGSYNGFRECKIEPDWLLIYIKDKTSLTFARTGTHSDLFE
jgi:mRNA interferase YafQ